MGQRPSHVKPPAHLSANPPVPQPEPIKAPIAGGDAEGGPDQDVDPLGLNPVRYGDWELKGIAIDF